MTTIANTAVAVVALLHFGFLVLEMFLWTQPLGLRTFGTTPDFAKASKALAANQGHGDVANPLRLTDIVDRNDLRVVERRHRLGLATKARQ